MLLLLLGKPTSQKHSKLLGVHSFPFFSIIVLFSRPFPRVFEWISCKEGYPGHRPGRLPASAWFQAAVSLVTCRKDLRSKVRGALEWFAYLLVSLYAVAQWGCSLFFRLVLGRVPIPLKLANQQRMPPFFPMATGHLSLFPPSEGCQI